MQMPRTTCNLSSVVESTLPPPAKKTKLEPAQTPATAVPPVPPVPRMSRAAEQGPAAADHGPAAVPDMHSFDRWKAAIEWKVSALEAAYQATLAENIQLRAQLGRQQQSLDENVKRTENLLLFVRGALQNYSQLTGPVRQELLAHTAAAVQETAHEPAGLPLPSDTTMAAMFPPARVSGEAGWADTAATSTAVACPAPAATAAAVADAADAVAVAAMDPSLVVTSSHSLTHSHSAPTPPPNELAKLHEEESSDSEQPFEWHTIWNEDPIGFVGTMDYDFS